MFKFCLAGADRKRRAGICGWIKKPVVTACAMSDVGCERANNEDNYIIRTCVNSDSAAYSAQTLRLPIRTGEWYLAGVFDGMGGGEAGELASRVTAETFLEIDRGVDRDTIDTQIRKAFQKANNRILVLQQQYAVFGTTGTVVCTDGCVCKVYHLGDSRGYLLRGGMLTQLTKDQTLAQMKIEVGMYSESDPQAQIDRHKLTEYIGRDRTEENLRPLEGRWQALAPGDVLLLCSDGLYDMCTDAGITKILSQNGSVKERAKQLVDVAKNGGGTDNITCVLLEVQ